MKTMNISLTAEMRTFVEQQVAKGRFGTASEYIRNLIRQEQLRQAEEDLDQKLLEGLQGEEIEMNGEFWQTIREEAAKRAKARKKKAA